jgi:hypothetical protein
MIWMCYQQLNLLLTAFDAFVLAVGTQCVQNSAGCLLASVVYLS